MFSDEFATKNRTIWWIDICDVGVVSCFASPKADPGRTTQGNGTEMTPIESALVDHVFLNERHVGKGVHMKVLVIGQNEYNIWLGILQGQRFLGWAICSCPTQEEGNNKGNNKGNTVNIVQHLERVKRRTMGVTYSLRKPPAVIYKSSGTTE